MVTDQKSLPAKKSVFNRIIGDSHFELEFASFLEKCSDVVAYAKNYLAINFKLDYINRDGNISHHYPDFIVKLPKNRIVIVETKGNADLDTALKMKRLRQWCEDVNKAQSEVRYGCLYVEQVEFEAYRMKSFDDVEIACGEYKK